MQFWGGVGAYLDFTNAATRAWWQHGVTAALLEHGIAATWNDNNEFEIWSDQAQIDGFGTPAPARQSKVLHTLLMLQASRAAQRAHAPATRPFLISRAGAAGLQRYVQTWSGDNTTSWETLRYNIRMGTSLALCGISNTGHDIGGFAGPKPDPELFLRWVQFGIFLPRFSIHSWNDDGTANEPWMYPDLTPQISALIKFRRKLTPYLYHLLWRYHRHYEPMIRPTLHDFPADMVCFAENDEMLLGPNLLVAAIVEPGARSRRVYLPAAGPGWYDFWTGEHYEGGQEITLPAPFDRPPLLARAGSAIPLNLAEQHFNHGPDERGFAVFPLQGTGHFEQECFEDDGDSEAYRAGQYGAWHLAITCRLEALHIAIRRTGACPPQASRLTLHLPPQERRRLELDGAALGADTALHGFRRVNLDLAPQL